MAGQARFTHCFTRVPQELLRVCWSCTTRVSTSCSRCELAASRASHCRRYCNQPVER